MLVDEFVIPNKLGLHARASALLVKTASRFSSDIKIERADIEVNGKSIMGIMMLAAFADIKWDDFSEAIPAFFAGIFMALCYSISYGIAAGFIFYCLTKIVKKQAEDVSIILWVSSGLFILNFVLLTIIPH